MNKSEFVKAVALKSELSQKDVEVFVKSYIDVVTEALQDGQKVSLPGFCSYEVKARAARMAINPATKEQISVAACNVPTCKMGKAYKANFND